MCKERIGTTEETHEVRIIHGKIWEHPFPQLDLEKMVNEKQATSRAVTDQDRIPHLKSKPADQLITDFLEEMIKMGYSDMEISIGLETAVYQRKQYGLT
jgi:DNA-binding transcriptional regulator YhcF (GntR family)